MEKIPPLSSSSIMSPIPPHQYAIKPSLQIKYFLRIISVMGVFVFVYERVDVWKDFLVLLSKLCFE